MLSEDKLEISRELGVLKDTRKKTFITVAVLGILSVALALYFLLGNSSISGMIVGNIGEIEHNPCVYYSGLGFLTEENISISENGLFLKLNCLPGEIKFHDDSDFIDVSPSGFIHIKDIENIPKSFSAFIVVQHESGNFIHKRFNFVVE